MTRRKADLLLLSVALAWSASYILLKYGLESMRPLNLIALRFGVAFVAGGVVFSGRLRKTNIRTILCSALLGTLLTAIFATLLYGMQRTSVSSAAFLGGLAVVFVPLLQAFLRRKLPKPLVFIGLVSAVAGIWLLSGGGVDANTGSFLCVLCSLIYAVYILLTERFAKCMDSLAFGVLQLGFAALFAFLLSLAFEKPVMPSGAAEWGVVLGLGLVCSAYGFIAQACAQGHTSPERVGIIFTLEPVFAALLAFIVLRERLPAAGYVGAALIVGGVLVSDRAEYK